MVYTVIKDGFRDCIMCNENKPLSEFNRFKYTTKQGKRSYRYDSRCVVCNRERRILAYVSNGHKGRLRARKYKEENRDILKAKRDIYIGNNRELYLAGKRSSQAMRKTGLSSGANALVLKQILDEAKFGNGYFDAYNCCVIQKPTIDHIKPLKRGGRHVYENLCVTSRQTNSQKNSRPFLIWLTESSL